MITKRKPTRYNILVSGETTKPQTLELLGSIVAFTPEQARHRGANQFADTLTTGTQPTDRVLRFLDKAGVAKREARNNPNKALPGKKRLEREKAAATAAAAAAAANG